MKLSVAEIREWLAFIFGAVALALEMRRRRPRREGRNLVLDISETVNVSDTVTVPGPGGITRRLGIATETDTALPVRRA